MFAFLFVLAALNPHVLAAIIVAHPAEAFVALGVVLNLLNGLLPATIRTGPVGTALHVLLDRVTVLTRRNAPGTLKWPIIAGSILRAVADSLNPPTPTMGLVEAKETTLDALTRGSLVPPEPFNPTATQDVTDAAYVARHTVAERPANDPSERGSASFGSLLFVVWMLAAVLGVGLGLMGCPNWNRPVCPTPGRWSCVEDWPRYCSPTRELTPIGDEPCAAQGRVCALRADGVARCAARPDAGLDTDGGQ